MSSRRISDTAPAAANVGTGRASDGAALTGSSIRRLESQASSSVSMRIPILESEVSSLARANGASTISGQCHR